MDDADLRFRDATLEDVTAIVALVESAYRGEASRAGWTTEADLLGGQRTDASRVQELIASPGSRIRVAERKGRLVGSIMLSDQGTEVYLGMLAVSPALQGSGLGSALLEDAERVARSHLRSTAARMTVIAQRTELIAWYGRRGYADTRERTPFPYGDLRSGIPKRADLYFVVLRKPLTV